ncbi:MAG: DUF4932 domain-containing protein [Candidatus Hydrogenedentes bacterium]|nr:DUF4932 domain-containing protein [Candidatus Hydrogenedentota bacterium]
MRKILVSVAISIAITVIITAAFFAFALWRSGQPQSAHFDAAYAQQHRGTVRVEIPEVYEMANVALALSEYGRSQPQAVRRGSAYYERVMAHFEPHATHPFIEAIDIKPGDYGAFYGFRENALRYRFEGTRIVRTAEYPNAWRPWPDRFTELLSLAQDFAEASKFRAFYMNEQGHYAALIDDYETAVPVREIWTWLEARFPARYDAYRVVISPLTGGSHSTVRCADNDFEETIMFVPAPAPAKEGESSASREARMARMVFTEIDHNYVNPVTQRHMFSVYRFVRPLSAWNAQEGYGDPPSTFNEYMTWGVFLLYARDTYDEEVFKQAFERETRFMEESRRFVRFTSFSKTLLRLYPSGGEARPIESIYPDVLGRMSAGDSPNSSTADS